MYSIAHVIHGVPLTPAIAAEIQRMEDDPDSDWSESGAVTCGFTQVYSGVASGMVGYCGVALTELSCVGEPVGLADLPAPTPEQDRLAQAAVAGLSPGLRALCPPVGTYLVFGTS